MIDSLINICIHVALAMAIFSPIVWLIGFFINIKDGARIAIKEANLVAIFGAVQGASTGLTLSIIWLFAGRILFDFTVDAIYFHIIFIIGAAILIIGLFATIFNL